MPRIKGPSRARGRGVFGRLGRPMRDALDARASTHNQRTLGRRIDAREPQISDRGWKVAKMIEDVGSEAKERPEA